MAYLPGSNADLFAQFYEYAGGPAAVITGLTIRITPTAGGAAVVGPTSTGITNPAPGMYAYTWAIPAEATIGDYLVYWSGTDAQSETVTASEIISVSATYAAWASVNDVYTITGFTPTNAQLATAGAVIDIYVNRTFSASGGMSARDLYWLKQAVAWQTVFEANNPGLAQRSLVTDINQDGLTARYPNEASVILAPLAQRAIRNLSWKGSRTLLPQKVGEARGTGVLVDYTRESTDVLHTWEPIYGRRR